jgi:hypothetical protein
MKTPYTTDLTLATFTPIATSVRLSAPLAGIATATLRGVTRTDLRATQFYSATGTLRYTIIEGITLRYRTSQHVWVGSATVWPSGAVSYDGGYATGRRGGATIVVGFAVPQ